jgi:hypothetical protein
MFIYCGRVVVAKSKSVFAYISVGVSLHHSSTGLNSIMISIFPAYRKHKAYIFERIAMTKKTTNILISISVSV